MNFTKVRLIIAREFITRVRKKSFILMTILGPILFAGITVAPAWLATMDDTEIKQIAVIDSSHLFAGKIPNTDVLKFKFIENAKIGDVKHTYKDSGYYAVLYIPHIITYSPDAVELFSDKQPSWTIKNHITDALNKELEHQKLLSYNIQNLESILMSVKSQVNIKTIQITEEGGEKESHNELNIILGYISGFLMYMLIFMFGVQVMRGVIEEKTSRIIEVIVSSVKPFELMIGKIVGISLVGLAQFFIWIGLTLALIFGAQQAFFPELSKTVTEQAVSADVMAKPVVVNNDKTAKVAVEQAKPDEAAAQMSEKTQAIKGIFNALGRINAFSMIGSFLFFFIGGYLLYASLFAAVGSAVDAETETQQFMMPITIPLILGIVMLGNAIQNPDGNLAFWFSMIPFTSPIVMMARIPFGVPWEQVLISAAALVITLIFTTWLSAKIYRTGILMYGKKVSFKELAKWMRYK